MYRMFYLLFLLLSVSIAPPPPPPIVTLPCPDQLCPKSTATASSAAASSGQTKTSASKTSANPSPTFSIQTKRYLYRCDDYDKNIEKEAWDAQLAIAQEAKNWQPGGRWQPAMDLYMGKDCASDPYKGQILGDFQNQINIHYANWIWPQRWIYIYCNEWNSSPYDGKVHCDPSSYAYSFTVKGWFHNSYNTVFCPRWYNEKRPLEAVVSDARSGKINKYNATALMLNRGNTYFHEMMHHTPLVARTQVEDLTYRPVGVASLARFAGCKGATDPRQGFVSSLLNADSYAVFATTTYFQEQLKMGTPPRPLDYDESKGYDILPLQSPESKVLPSLGPKDDLSHLGYDANAQARAPPTAANLPLE